MQLILKKNYLFQFKTVAAFISNIFQIFSLKKQTHSLIMQLIFKINYLFQFKTVTPFISSIFKKIRNDAMPKILK